MKRMRLICIAVLTLTIALFPIAAHAEATQPYDILENFRWDSSIVDLTSPELEAGNAEYIAELETLIQDSDAVYTDAYLCIQVDRYIATDDCTVLTWQVTNLSDEILYVSTSEFDALFNGIEYDICGGRTWKNYAIRPGETVNSRFMGTLWEHVQPGDGTFTLDMKVYEIGEDALPDDYFTDTTGKYTSGDYAPDESDMQLCDAATLSVPMIMAQSISHSALKDDEPIEKEFDGYTLRITCAEINDISFSIEYDRIYESEEQALADSPIGTSYWEYRFNDITGANWVQQGFGSIPDDPYELSDGRWAWHIEYKVYYMFMQPDTIVMHPHEYVDGTGFIENDDTSEDVELTFSYTEQIGSSI